MYRQPKQLCVIHLHGDCYDKGSCAAAMIAGVAMDVLKSVGHAITSLPENFTPHRQIKKVYESRRAMIESGGLLLPKSCNCGVLLVRLILSTLVLQLRGRGYKACSFLVQLASFVLVMMQQIAACFGGSGASIFVAPVCFYVEH
eukprot:GHUV01032156.1.p1 GENE.GHUV01032156.1~~GHUV01032156.1.p1  ORF type:complete len:144 (-),score=29.61 GHUV01032156.1:273-704(-)